MTDYYSLLGLSFDFADAGQLRTKYRRAALLAHPDRHSGSSARFLELKSALETLQSQSDRRAYDHVTFRTLRVPCDMRAVVEERPEGDVVVASWQREEREAFVLRVRGEGTLEWTECFRGTKRRVAVQGLTPGVYELAVSVPGGPPRVAGCVVPDRVEERIEQLGRLAGFGRTQAVKALARHGSVQAVLDDLMRRGTTPGKKKVRKKKKKKEPPPVVAPAAVGEWEQGGDDTIDEVFLLANVKCSRCKVCIALEQVESHVCVRESGASVSRTGM
jgi:hypothetical protein